MSKNILWASLLVLMLVTGPAISGSNFVAIKLPGHITIDVPKNWIVMSNNLRITLDTSVESQLDLNNIANPDSSLPFAANYLEGGRTEAMVNVRYYPSIEFTQRDVSGFSAEDVAYLDKELENSIRLSAQAVGMQITTWAGTKKRRINGLTTFVTEYHRNSQFGDGTFRVRLVRVIAKERSFTLTVSYSQRRSHLLENITDRMISSLALGKST